MAVTVTRLDLVVAAFMLAATLTVDAQQVQKVYRIGYMSVTEVHRYELQMRRESLVVAGR